MGLRPVDFLTLYGFRRPLRRGLESVPNPRRSDLVKLL